MSELLTTEQHIYTTLASDAALADLVGAHIYPDFAPTTTQYPCIVFRLKDASDTYGVGAERQLTNALYIVEAITKDGCWEDIDPIVSRIDELLHKSAGTETAAGTCYGSVRTAPFSQIEIHDDTTYHRRGGKYLVYSL